jgi:SnoaL-like protein
MRSAAKLVEDYIALWNETDQQRRLALLEATWTTDATYVDPLMQGTGHPAIDGLIAAVQAKFPAFRFALARPADGFGNYVRFSWALGPPDGDAIIKGTDFLARDGDRIKSVTGFLDHVPAAT